MRLIDADALLENTKAYFGDCIDKQDSEIIDNTILIHNKNISKIIRQAPSVEMPRGEWVYWEGWMSNHDQRIDDATCSECGYKHHTVRRQKGDGCNSTPAKLYNFCPNCGADMRGEGE